MIFRLSILFLSFGFCFGFFFSLFFSFFPSPPPLHQPKTYAKDTMAETPTFKLVLGTHTPVRFMKKALHPQHHCDFYPHLSTTATTTNTNQNNGAAQVALVCSARLTCCGSILTNVTTFPSSPPSPT